jgi:hypothetical protein
MKANTTKGRIAPRPEPEFVPKAYTPTANEIAAAISVLQDLPRGGVAGVVGIEGGVVSGVLNLESSGVGASDWRPRHE